MRITRRWQVWVSLIAGAWLFVSPWVLGYTTAVGGMWAAFILGGLTVVVAMWSLIDRDARAAETIMALIGALVFIVPWVIGFAGLASARLDAWIVGAVIVVASLWALMDEQGGRERRAKPLA